MRSSAPGGRLGEIGGIRDLKLLVAALPGLACEVEHVQCGAFGNPGRHQNQRPNRARNTPRRARVRPTALFLTRLATRRGLPDVAARRSAERRAARKRRDVTLTTPPLQ
jgi:hypothetical protein